MGDMRTRTVMRAIPRSVLRTGAASMSAHARIFLSCLVGAFLQAGCAHQVYSPPARMLPLESAATLSEGETGVQVEGAVHEAAFGGSAESGAVRVRHGFGANVEGALEADGLHIDGHSVAHTYPDAFAARAGIKAEILGHDLSITAGLGTGGSAGGGFVSPDAGIILAFENSYVVPFASVRASASLPFDRHTVDTGGVGDSMGEYLYQPPLTWIGGGLIGFRVPFGCKAAPCDTSGSFLAGLGLTYLAATGTSTTFASLAAGGELAF
jgi:hypothetical protein